MSQQFQQVEMSDINPPKVGMVFRSPEEAFQFYKQYSCKVGFGITKRTSHKFHGIKCDATFACNKNRPTSQKNQQEGTGSRSKGSGGTGCRAKIVLKDCLLRGCWSIEEVILEHNHDLSPGSARLIVPDFSQLRNKQKYDILYASSHQVLLDMLEVASQRPDLEHTLLSGLLTLHDKIVADAAPVIQPTSVQPEEHNTSKDSVVACSKRRYHSMSFRLNFKKIGNKKQKSNAPSTQKKKSASEMKQPEMCAEPPQPKDHLFLSVGPQPNHWRSQKYFIWGSVIY